MERGREGRPSGQRGRRGWFCMQLSWVCECAEHKCVCVGNGRRETVVLNYGRLVNTTGIFNSFFQNITSLEYRNVLYFKRKRK